MNTEPGTPWWEAEPERLTFDLADVTSVAPGLTFCDGRWVGHLPRWPFARPQPAGLDVLVPVGMVVSVEPSPAHPLVEPAIYPVDQDIEVARRLDHRWHVSGDGRLCLLRGPLDWNPEDRISELLLKAAGWRCELALLQAGVIEKMSETGMVTDACFDLRFAEAASLQAAL